MKEAVNKKELVMNEMNNVNGGNVFDDVWDWALANIADVYRSFMEDDTKTHDSDLKAIRCSR